MTDQMPEPMIDADEDIPPIEVNNALVTFMLRIDDVETLPEVIDLAMVNVARYGLENLDVYIEDADVPERRWLLRKGALFDLLALREPAGDDTTDG